MNNFTQNFYKKKGKGTVNRWLTTLCLTVVIWLGAVGEVTAQTWLASAASGYYNSGDGLGYTVSGLGTFYRGVSGGVSTFSTDAVGCNGSTQNIQMTSSTAIFKATVNLSGIVLYGNSGTGSNRTLSSIQTSLTLNGTYTAVTGSTASGNLSGTQTTNFCSPAPMAITFGSVIAAGTFIRITLSGNAYIAAIAFVPSCTALTLTYNLTGGISICSGGSASLGLSGSQTNVSYQLYNGAATVGLAVAGTGSAISFAAVSPTTTTTYSVKARGTGGAYCTTETSAFASTSAVTVTTTPTPAAAGSSQSITDGAAATLAANAPTVGTGAWSIVSGPSSLINQFSSISSPTATFTPAGGVGNYVLRWTISNSPCNSSASDVTIIVNATTCTSASITTSPSASTVCQGNATSFSVVATGLIPTYKWQYSTDGTTGWSDLTNTGAYSNATTVTLNISNAATTAANGFYRCVVSVACDSSTATSAAAQLIINVFPTITSVSPATICTSGTVNLSAVASSATATINWYAAATGGSSLNLGTNFTTPSISTTTNYYVDATENGCTTASRTQVTATVNNPTISGGDILSTGSTLQLSGITSGGVWTSDNTSVATVDGTGIVTGAAVGTANITYTFAASGCTDTKAISVTILTNPTDYFRSTGSTVWNAARTWEASSDGSTNWHASSLVPGTSAQGVEILTGHIVGMSTAIITNNVTINNGGELDINTGGAITINASKVLTVNGILKNTLTTNPFTLTGTMTVSATGVYNMSGNGGTITIPTATWNSASTIKITGIVAATIIANTVNSVYGNYYIDCPNMGNITVVLFPQAGIRITGDFTVNATGTGVLQMISSSATNILPIDGNYLQSTGTVLMNPSSQAATTFRPVVVKGNFTLDGGTFRLSNNTANCYLIVKGNFTVNNSAVIENIGAANGSGAAYVHLAGDGAQSYTRSVTSAITATVGNKINFVVNSGTILDMGTSIINGSANVNVTVSGAYIAPALTGTTTVSSNLITITGGSMTGILPGMAISGGSIPANTYVTAVYSGTQLQLSKQTTAAGSSVSFTVGSASAATIITANADGLDGAFANGGTKTLSAATNYEFNGTVAQTTGTLIMPATVNNLTINNSAGVTLSAVTTTISGNLSITGNASIGAGQNIPVGSLTLGGVAQASGSTYGGTGSNARTINSTYFAATTGTVSVGPSISFTGTLANVDTTYGTASPTPATFSVSGVSMTAGILVTPPSGYEVSLTLGSGYGSTVTVGAAGTIASTPVYVRLSASTAAGSYSGNVVLSSASALSRNVATVSSVVYKADQTITFEALAPKTFGDASYALTGTASSGLGVTYTSSDLNVATVSGSTVTIVGAGTTTITASQVGNANYNPAPDATQTLTVAPANSWIGGTSNWNTAGNWSLGNVPSNTDNIIISSGSPTLDTNFTLASGRSLSISGAGTLTINPTSVLTLSGTANFGGRSVVLKSDATGTGTIGQVTGTLTGAINVTAERYIPSGKRAFRFLTPSVTTSGTIYANWQNNGATTAGIGIQITGSTTGANGFDATASGSPSMYTYQNTVATGTGWLAIPNTDSTSLVAGMGYRTLVRGDRNVNITVASSDNMNVATTISATGTLKVGDVVFNSASTPALNNTISTTSNPTTNDYSLIGNPYASPVDWELVSRTNVDDFYYTWDPNMGTTTERGRYVAYSASSHTATNTGSGTSYVNRYIQPGQAIFVKTTAASPVVTFKEADKNATFTNVFRTITNSTLSVSVYNPSEVAFAAPIDGTIAVFGTDFNASVGIGDVVKMYSAGEHLAWSKDTKLLSIDATIPVVANDQLLLKTMQFAANKSYTFKVSATNFDTSLTGYLVDQYLNSQTQLDFNTANFITFATTTDVNSYGADRFKVVFSPSVLNTNVWNESTVHIYPNPVTNNQFAISVPSSTNGKVTVTIHNLIGQSVYKESTSAINNTIVVSPSALLKAGVYSVAIENEGKRSTQKIIVK